MIYYHWKMTYLLNSVKQQLITKMQNNKKMHKIPFSENPLTAMLCADYSNIFNLHFVKRHYVKCPLHWNWLELIGLYTVIKGPILTMSDSYIQTTQLKPCSSNNGVKKKLC
ncbi:hypothetical protein ACROYT_G005920 [Oculina patagonica]